MQNNNPPKIEPQNTAPDPSDVASAPADTASSEQPAQSLESLRAEIDDKDRQIAKLKAENQQFTVARECEDTHEKIIKLKMQIGLTRQQATTVVKLQHRLHEAEPARYLSVEDAHQTSLRHRPY